MRKGSQIISGKMLLYGNNAYQGNYLCVTLTEPVRPDVLQRSVDKAVESQPWACYGVEEDAGALFYHDGLEKSLTVHELVGDTLPELGSDVARNHLIGVYYRDRSIYLSAFHGLTDGAGEMMFANDMLGWYAHEVLGVPYQGGLPAEDMDAEPFEVLGDVLARAGLKDVPTEGMSGLDKDFLIEEELQSTGDEETRHIRLHMDAADFMAFAKREQVKASAALCALYAAAVLAVHPDNTKPLRIAVPANMRSVLGIPGTHRNAAMPPLMFDVADCEGLGLHELSQQINQLIVERSSDPAKLIAMKALSDLQASIPALPFAQTEQLLAANTSGTPQFTFNCSYMYRYTNEPYLPLVEDAYTFAPSYGRGTVLVVMALPERFVITINQGGETDAYVNAFVEQLRAEGIKASIVGEVPVQGAYVALRETLGLKA